MDTNSYYQYNMGIKDYQSLIKSRFTESFIDTNINIYDYIYIDMNYIFHVSISNCRTMNEFIKKTKLYLNTIFSNFIATKKIYFAIDGPSSYAKMILQRKRRMACVDSLSNNVVSSLCISPGTNMMKRLEEFLCSYVNSLHASFGVIKPKIYMSSSNESGEGEVKICNQIILNSADLNHKHLIIGNDADIIVLSMGAIPVKNVNILINGNVSLMVSLNILIETFHKSLNNCSCVKIMNYNDAREDFVVLSIMMGNDYLPKLGFVTSEKIWSCYYDYMNKGGNLLMKDGKFNQKNMRNFMWNVYTKLSPANKKVSIEMFNNQRAASYLSGILWCLHMYKTGICPDYTYAYTSGVVHPCELILYLYTNNVELQVNSREAINAYVYPLMIMPYGAKCLVPNKFHKLMDGPLSYLYEMEKCVTCIGLRKIYGVSYCKMNKTETDDDKKLYNEDLNKYKLHRKTHCYKFGIAEIEMINELVK